MWKGILTRCYNSNNKSYKYYGKKGIKMCKRWRHSYDNFASDMGERPEGTSIDRIDSNGNYEPGNCKWSTPTEQTQNRRNMHKVAPDLGECAPNGSASGPTHVSSRGGKPRTESPTNLHKPASNPMTAEERAKIEIDVIKRCIDAINEMENIEARAGTARYIAKLFQDAADKAIEIERATP